MSTRTTTKTPRIWKYLFGATFALLFLVLAWAVFVVLVIQPQSLTQEATVTTRVLWFIAGPVIIVTGFFVWRWEVNSGKAETARIHAAQVASRPSTAESSQQPQYVLEVLSLGVTLDKYRQGALWEVLARGNPKVSIREQDPNKYPWSEQDKSGQEGGRASDTTENGASPTPEYWGAPSFFAGAPFNNPAHQPSDINPVAGQLGGADTNGMSFHLFVIAPWEVSERPDRLLERVFAFFDEHADVPYVLVTATDGLYLRDLNRLPNTPNLIENGYYVPSMPDSSALLVLARRERVDALRPFAWDDPDNQFLQKKLRYFYYDLQESVPVIESMKAIGRQPTVAEWLKAAGDFTQRPDVYPKGFSSLADDLNPFSHLPPRDFKPTPWFPVPWTKDQLATFDRLPTLGFLHRPVFVKTVDDKGQPLSRRDERTAALAAGWQQALQTLPESERKTAPAHIISATGGNVEQTIALHDVMNAWTAQGGPQFDSAKSTQWIDTDARLGNTGAATWFMQMAIGVMGSYREGGTSAAINLRDPSEASIVFISPPDDKRKHQSHPEGGDVFGHNVTPAVDPANYERP